jgi:hypothetical protein
MNIRRPARRSRVTAKCCRESYWKPYWKAVIGVVQYHGHIGFDAAFEDRTRREQRDGSLREHAQHLTVLMQMFGARMPGFMPPKKSVRDALIDLQAHQLGMISGIRAIIAAMLQSFNPSASARFCPKATA